MEQNWRELKVLVLVKTYPRPSQHHQEVVCTAGMTEEGKWIRLYPINYRYRPYTQWFRKYEWIKVVAVKHSNDPRPESYRILPWQSGQNTSTFAAMAESPLLAQRCVRRDIVHSAG